MSSKRLKEGDPAPDFTAYDQNGDRIALSDFKGKKLVLYFYPKDLTPGCTAEACDLADHYRSLLDHGFEVVGVSPDIGEQHRKFIDKHELPFDLIADPDMDLIQKYGAYGEKTVMGQKKEGVLRHTFLIDEEGKIEKVFRKVRTKDHANQILEAVAA
ncbi:MAG: thioredoxin-dependent thiol peroxidase [Flavobacteriales bacterium]